ncbi:alpha/beta hydrolase fold domain-containing protein [Frigidibacter sp. MR17.24]|uniref:alpha/beta hydrolase fold domain-containing protein n=1 Tax=Frigidibacter sp. MR17.24 TaxID=3127345 RepID=UPI0030129E7F
MTRAPQGWAALAAHIRAHPVEGSPARRRAAFLALSCGGPAGRDEAIGGVRCVRHGPEGGVPVLWLHGGGLVFGSPESHAAGAARLAALTGRPVILPDYRLAPDHPWPAPLDDTLAVIDALAPGIDLAGDSAGGLLALCAALARPGRIGRLALISPNTDRSGQSLTRAANSPRDLMNDDATDAALARLAFGGAPPATARPLEADLSALPPVWITASTDEVLADDALLLIRALGLARVPVTAEIRAIPSHMWTLWPEATPEAQATYASLARALARRDAPPP